MRQTVDANRFTSIGKNFHAETMQRADKSTLPNIWYVTQSLDHFIRCLIGEGEGQHFELLFLRKKAPNSFRKDASLSRARSSKDQKCTIFVCDDLLLCCCQFNFRLSSLAVG